MMMKTMMMAVLAAFGLHPVWSDNFSQTQQKAKISHQPILISFSGSDWCGPCIRLRTEILESKEFETYAEANLLLVRADFPRQKKNQPSKEQVKLNEALAEQYNKEGKFPYTVLVDENGKVLKKWDGLPDENPEQFVREIGAFNDKK